MANNITYVVVFNTSDKSEIEKRKNLFYEKKFEIPENVDFLFSGTTIKKLTAKKAKCIILEYGIDINKIYEEVVKGRNTVVIWFSFDETLDLNSTLGVQDTNESTKKIYTPQKNEKTNKKSDRD